MRKLRVGINGFGRIGRTIFRINHRSSCFDVVAINDINPDTKNIAYLLQYDCTYGRFPETVGQDGDELLIESQRIPVHHERQIMDVPWEKCGADVVIDSSGVKSHVQPMLEYVGGVKNFIVTNDPGPTVKTIIFGVNENELNPAEHKVISSSICDTIALTPLVKQISETHEIESGFLTTLHPWLPYQNLLDGPSVSWAQPGDIYSHYALGRASTENVIPKSTSAILAAERVFAGISDTIQSFSYRIPTPVVSSAVLVLWLNDPMEQDALVQRLQQVEETQRVRVVHNTTEPLTSTDYRGVDYSVIVDHRWTQVQNDRHVKLVYWYDNEWGYSSRVVDLIKYLGEYY